LYSYKLSFLQIAAIGWIVTFLDPPSVEMAGEGGNFEDFMANLIRQGTPFELPPKDDQLPEGEDDGSQYLNPTEGDDNTNSNEENPEEENVPEVYIERERHMIRVSIRT